MTLNALSTKGRIEDEFGEVVGKFWYRPSMMSFTLQCGKRIGQFPAFPEALQELVDRGFPVTCDLCDLPAAHSIGEMKNEHSLVVHIRTSS